MELVVRAAPPLPAPVSGEAATVVPAGPLVIGGLDSSEASVEGVFLLGRSGRLQAVGSLAGPLHDAAATTVGEKVLVFGGGTETSTDQVQSLPAGISPGSEAKATVVGQLPAVRSDLSAVTVGSKAYVLGGYDDRRRQLLRSRRRPRSACAVHGGGRSRRPHLRLRR
jgi:hypothetical protein